MTEVMILVQGILDKCHIIQTEGIHLEADPEVPVIKEVYIEGHIFTEIAFTVDNRQKPIKIIS